MSTVITPPLVLAPGIHRNITESEYHRINFCSNSRLTTLNDHSPAHVRDEIENPKEPTPALVIGSALHALVLAPDQFKKQFVVADVCGAVKKDGQRCTNPGVRMLDDTWLCGVHEKTGRDDNRASVLTQVQADQVMEMRDSILSHKEAAAIIEHSADRELSVIFNEPINGLRCKMRADLVSEAANLIADVKTTDSAHPRDFERTIFKYGYHRQAAMYQAGLSFAGKLFKDFAFIAVEKEPPYAVAVYQLEEAAIKRGWEELEPLMAVYHECERLGNWPAFAGVNYIGLPPWAIKTASIY